MMATATEPRRHSVVPHVGGLHYASEKAVVERVLGARPGVLAVEANPVAQTANVEYDPAQTDVDALKQRVEECGFHCAGRSVPGHVCDPLARREPLAPALDHDAVGRSDQADGHGHGGHAGMSMAAMVADLRNRFLVALVFAIPIAIWSPMGKSLLGSTPPTPFGMRTDLWQLFLSLPVVLYASRIFFRGAYRVGHWFEMRARGGANDAKVPVDAEVVEGSSSVDESMVTGESLPVSKQPGAKLVGATIDKQGAPRARATAVGSDTALAQIVRLVQEAHSSKAPAQRLADRAA